MSSHRELDNESLFRLVNGNPEAMEWVEIGRSFIHMADDMIDVDVPDGSRINAVRRACRLAALQLNLYTHPFFLKNMAALKYAMLRNLHAYEDSVVLEDSATPWHQHFSDWARHGWLEVCITVGDICAGYHHTAGETLEMRALAYANHHDKDGKNQ